MVKPYFALVFVWPWWLPTTTQLSCMLACFKTTLFFDFLWGAFWCKTKKVQSKKQKQNTIKNTTTNNSKNNQKKSEPYILPLVSLYQVLAGLWCYSGRPWSWNTQYKTINYCILIGHYLVFMYIPPQWKVWGPRCVSCHEAETWSMNAHFLCYAGTLFSRP